MLNLEQKKAVEIIDSPLVVIAGPGTGKTALITEKIKFLLEEKKYKEDEILAITFTNKAAKEMSERVEVLTEKPFLAKTFHEFCLDIIEEYQKEIPQIDKDYKLIDEVNQLLFFLENLDEFNLKSVVLKNNSNLIAHELQSSISKLKDFGISLLDLEKLKTEDMTTKMDVFLAYSKYEQYKKKNNFLDFGDLLLYVLDLLKNNSEIREGISSKYKYVLVDEFQDTNKVQLEILKIITKNNVTIVGDQKQSIYGFRGANFGNLEDFKTHYKDFKEVYLHENYRSSKSVIENVNKLVLDITNKDELLKSNLDFKGEVNLIEAQLEDSQHSYIAQKISQIQDKEPNAKIGILCRRKIELINTGNFLKNLGIKYNTSEVNNFFELEIIKSVLRELKIIAKPKESGIEVFKLLVDYGIRNETIRKLFRTSKLKEKSFVKILGDLKSDFEDENDLLKNIAKKIEDLTNLKNSKSSLYDVVRETIFKFNNYQNVILNNDLDSIAALNNFLKFVKKYLDVYSNNDLERFLKICSYTKSLEVDFNLYESSHNVELLTIHNSKGKEFDYVFIPYLNDRRFPTSFKRSKFELLNEESKDNFLAEEKRLFFVAASRAKKELNLIYVKRYNDNKLDSKPSELLKVLELEKQIFDVVFDDLKLDKREEKKIEIIDKIKNFLIDEDYVRAISEINNLKSLTSKKSDLNYFMGKSEDKVVNNKEDNLEVDFSSHIYSVSQVKTFESCPKKYMYSYVYKVPGVSKHYFDFGTSVHNVLENLVLEIKKYPKDILFAKSVSDLKKNWISKGYENSTQEKEYFEKGVEAIKNFIDTHINLLEDKREVVGIEDKFVIDIEGKKVMGFIDRIDKIGDEFEILDYKTSNSIESKKDLEENLQLFVYSLAVEKLKGKLPQKVGLWYLIHNKIVNVEIKDINIKKLKEKMVSLINEIEKNKFDAKPSFFSCKFCDYNEICPDSK